MQLGGHITDCSPSACMALVYDPAFTAHKLAFALGLGNLVHCSDLLDSVHHPIVLGTSETRMVKNNLCGEHIDSIRKLCDCTN